MMSTVLSLGDIHNTTIPEAQLYAASPLVLKRLPR